MGLASILTALALIAGGTYIWSTYAGSALQRYLFKPLTTALILGIALTVPTPISEFYRWMVVIGILCSMGGDIFLMLPQDRFVFGLASFLLAHIFYILAYNSRTGFHFTGWIFAVYAIYTIGLLYLLWPHIGAVRIAVFLYGVVLMVMGWQAAEQWWAVRDLSALLAMVGAILFLASDSTLALNKFRAPVPQHDLIVMTTYYGAQLLIAWSVFSFAG